MKKIPLLFLLFLCTVSAFSQNVVPLDTGLNNSIKYFEGRIAKGTKLVVLSFKSPTPQLSEYIEEELTSCFVNSPSFTLVDRANLALLQKEMEFQFSGEVSDDDIRSIGKKLGAQTVVTGSIEAFGDVFRLRIRAISIESAAIQGMYSANILRDRILASLAAPPPAAPSGGNAPQGNSPPPVYYAPPPSSPDPGGTGGGRVSLPDYLLN